MGSNQFYFLDTNDKADEDDNIGFASRRSLLELAPNDVFTEILLNRYSFFESLDNQFYQIQGLLLNSILKQIII